MEKVTYNSNRFVTCGFILAIGLLVMIIVLWKYNEFIREQQVTQVDQYQFEYRTIQKMQHSADHRAISLYKMASLRDPFEIDEAYLEFQKIGENIMKARDTLASLNLRPEEKSVWNDIRKIMNRGYSTQYDVIQLIHEENFDEASSHIRNVVSPIQDDFQEKLQELAQVKQNQLVHARNEAKSLDSTIDIYIYLLSVATLILGVMTIYVTRKNTKTDSVLATHAYKIRSLYEVASQKHETFDQQIDATLRVGCQLFELEIGKLCKIDAEQQTNQLINVVVPENFKTILKKNMKLPLERTFCSIPFQEDRTVLLSNIATSEYRTYPCYEFANLGSYIATPVYVFGKKYGTINFSSFKAKKCEYNAGDDELLYLIGKFVSVIIETKKSQQMVIDKKASDDANKAKSRFLSNMSHELRTPLNAIIGYSDLLAHDADISDEIVLGDIKRINKAGLHLLHLVNNVLDISKVEAGKMAVYVETFELDGLLKLVTDIMTPLVNENNNVLRIKNKIQNLSLSTDQQKLKQIMLNLISNAAKFTRDGEIAIIIEQMSKFGEPHLSLTIKDTGAGISEKAQATIFAEFTQDAGNQVTLHSGTGLGLSICKSFSTILGGTIQLQSQKGLGSEFQVIIPITLTLENCA